MTSSLLQSNAVMLQQLQLRQAEDERHRAATSALMAQVQALLGQVRSQRAGAERDLCVQGCPGACWAAGDSQGTIKCVFHFGVRGPGEGRSLGILMCVVQTPRPRPAHSRLRGVMPAAQSATEHCFFMCQPLPCTQLLLLLSFSNESAALPRPVPALCRPILSFGALCSVTQTWPTMPAPCLALTLCSGRPLTA